MLYKIVSFVVVPVGLVLWVLLLSGFAPLMALADRSLQLEISVTNGVVFSLPMFIFVFSLLLFAHESWEIANLGSSETDVAFGALQTNQITMSRWRHERNWWMAAFNLVLWFTNYRLGALNRIRRLAESPHKD
mmetsp:Transcript_7946/g.14593  ORF Transcript_7946/g.14593 Transcript_7946/m.14593 type:complete len:133 (-) Transcript_7946:142-540(-)